MQWDELWVVALVYPLCYPGWCLVFPLCYPGWCLLLSWLVSGFSPLLSWLVSGVSPTSLAGCILEILAQRPLSYADRCRLVGQNMVGRIDGGKVRHSVSQNVETPRMSAFNALNRPWLWP